MKYKTSFFNAVSPDYPKIEENFVALFWKNKTSIIIEHNLTKEELNDFKTFLSETSELQIITYGKNVNIETIEKINNLLKNTKYTPIQNLNRNLTKEESRKLDYLEVNTDIFITQELLEGKTASIKEQKAYENLKTKIFNTIKELELSELESSAYIYGYLRDNYILNDSISTSVYKTILTGTGTEKTINTLLYSLLKEIGLNVLYDKELNTIKLQISDKKYNTNGEYNLDIVTDINIKDVLDAENLYTKFLEGINKETLSKVVDSLNRKLKLLETVEKEEINENQGVQKEKKEIQETKLKEDIPVISDNTMTFAIPLSEIQTASENYGEKKEINEGTPTGMEFIEKEMITDENSFGEYLIRNGANENIVKNIIGNQISNYYKIIDSKKNEKIAVKNINGKKEIYIPTTEYDNHSMKVVLNEDGTVTIINNEYSNFMDNGIRYGSTSIFEFSLNKEGKVTIVEKLNQISEVSKITPEMILPVYNLYAKKSSMNYNSREVEMLSSEDVSVTCTKDSGKLIAANIDENYKEEKARSLGFDEKYYNKKKIAGLNKYSDGKEIYITEEDLDEEFDESGLVSKEEMVLVKTSGKANILFISSIVGFVIGLGIGLAILILNIR